MKLIIEIFMFLFLVGLVALPIWGSFYLICEMFARLCRMKLLRSWRNNAIALALLCAVLGIFAGAPGAIRWLIAIPLIIAVLAGPPIRLISLLKSKTDDKLDFEYFYGISLTILSVPCAILALGMLYTLTLTIAGSFAH